MSAYNEKVEAVVVKLSRFKIVPVLAIEKVEDGLKMCELLDRCGLKIAEITFRTAAAEEIIRQASKKFPELVIGAGTVLNIEDLHRAFNAGASFAVAPGLNPAVVKEAIKNEYPFFPGISCPTHIEQAYELGVKVMKFFPAKALGGVKMLKAVIPPYRHLGIKLIPTGGISSDNIKNYLELPEVIAAGGTWLGTSADIRAGEWDKIEQLVRDAIKLLE
ncbi:MAG: bifunctional 4-hydroxy-2-oxoglutarate aldolase/2-dehydro-3-deoxy-phosphogluconate aldolase [Victivallaceae bacterium]